MLSLTDQQTERTSLIASYARLWGLH